MLASVLSRVVKQVQKLVNNWLVATSFSIGVADTVADTETIMTIGGIIDTAKRSVNGDANGIMCRPDVSSLPEGSCHIDGCVCFITVSGSVVLR